LGTVVSLSAPGGKLARFRLDLDHTISRTAA
jgi:hypothetical protein